MQMVNIGFETFFVLKKKSSRGHGFKKIAGSGWCWTGADKD
jgi:hypothetical protein